MNRDSIVNKDVMLIVKTLVRSVSITYTSIDLTTRERNFTCFCGWKSSWGGVKECLTLAA